MGRPRKNAAATAVVEKPEAQPEVQADERPALTVVEGEKQAAPGLDVEEKKPKVELPDPFEFICSAESFKTAMAIAGRAVSSKPTHPVLANVLIAVDEEKQEVKLTSFDLSLGISIAIPAQVVRSGSTTIAANLLGAIVNKVPDGDLVVSISYGENESISCQIKTASGSYRLRGMDPAEFPELPNVSGASLTLPVSALTLIAKKVLFCVSTDETKQVLTGVRFSSADGRLECAATDGHRMSVASMLLPADADDKPKDDDKEVCLEHTIPGKAVQELCSLLARSIVVKSGGKKSDEQTTEDRKEPVVRVFFDEHQIRFETEKWTMTSRLLEGQYPNYRQLIPVQFAYQAGIDRLLFLQALERIGVLADQKNNVVKMNFKSGAQEVAVTVDAPDVGDGEEVVPIAHNGGDLQIAFNIRYVIDALKAADTTYVDVKMNTNKSPVVYAPRDGIVEWICLVMPIQLRDGLPG